MECKVVDNITNESEESQMLPRVSNVIYGYVLPIICVFGIVGNILNLAILTRRKLTRSFKTLEQAANICLTALALSDLMFCLFAFPTTFLPKDDLFEFKGFLLYYRIYCDAVINVFILTSTWLTVTMSVERYLAICHPFKQTFFLTIAKTKVIIVIVYIVSAVFNIPILWRYEIIQKVCQNSSGNILAPADPSAFSTQFRQKFKKDEQQSNQSDAGQTLTITLVVIVVMFLILVAPSEMVMHVAQLSHNENNATFKMIEVVLNFMQSINFSVNFILYCIISPYFRRTLKYMLCCSWYFLRKKNYYLEISMKRMTFANYTKKSTL
ncbi:hypothetical protein ACJMK2_009156 [Sinanodonta woodiana]|uniref:G-protein coupled receptors family 1 profile domain-containing protein n=1 Tax=Sinanodonta woodiana TaxID=1069815 RepID=A0ABD3VED1_SINWO